MPQLDQRTELKNLFTYEMLNKDKGIVIDHYPQSHRQANRFAETDSILLGRSISHLSPPQVFLPSLVNLHQRF